MRERDRERERERETYVAPNYSTKHPNLDRTELIQPLRPFKVCCGEKLSKITPCNLMNK